MIENKSVAPHNSVLQSFSAILITEEESKGRSKTSIHRCHSRMIKTVKRACRVISSVNDKRQMCVSISRLYRAHQFSTSCNFTEREILSVTENHWCKPARISFDFSLEFYFSRSRGFTYFLSKRE